MYEYELCVCAREYVPYLIHIIQRYFNGFVARIDFSSSIPPIKWEKNVIYAP